MKYLTLFVPVFLLAALSFTGCGEIDDSTPDPAAEEAFSIKDDNVPSGCHLKCPHCKHGELCKFGCMLICPHPDEPEVCGSATCPEGQVCCNSSCGICTPPGGFCTMQYCGPVL
jgi:hypothetical protein